MELRQRRRLAAVGLRRAFRAPSSASFPLSGNWDSVRFDSLLRNKTKKTKQNQNKINNNLSDQHQPDGPGPGEQRVRAQNMGTM